MLSTAKPPRYHPAGESEDEEYDDISFGNKQKVRIYNQGFQIDCESQFHKEIAAGNLDGVRDAFDNGALLKVVNKIHSGGYNGLMTACSLGYWDIVAYLIEVGADPNFNNVDLFTPLMAVCFSFSTNEENLSRCVGILFEKGANLNAVDTSGTTPLMYACKFGHVRVAKELLKMGANYNMQDNQGWSALFWAVNKGNLECVQMLLKAGAKKKLKDNNKKTAYSIALSKKSKEDILIALNPKWQGKPKLAAKEAEEVIDNGVVDWAAKLNCFVSSESVPKYKGMKLNLFQFLTATEDDLIFLGMKYFWQRKQTLLFIKHYHLQPWVQFKPVGKHPQKMMVLPKESPPLTYITAANQILAVHTRLVIIQASAVFLRNQFDDGDFEDDVGLTEVIKNFIFGLNDMVKEVQNILQSLEKADKSIISSPDFIEPLPIIEGKSNRPIFLTVSALACLGAFVFWKRNAIFGTAY